MFKIEAHEIVTEFNDELGRMTHSNCEPSWTFQPQEFALPETMTTIRRMVNKLKDVI